MTKLVPYNVLIGGASSAAAVTQVVEVILHDLLRELLCDIEVDEKWYRSKYADVKVAVTEGQIQSAREHYVTSGYFEDRLPRHVVVDETWYIDTNMDVAEAISDGRVASAQDHFEQTGFREGRLPFKDWTL